jgi:hypothetical protein
MKLLLLILLFAPCGLAVIAQKSSAKVIVEFSEVSCDEQTYYLSRFATALAEAPGSKGIAVFYPQKGQPEKALDFENRFRVTAKFMRFPDDLAIIIRAKPQRSTKVEYWVVPVGADPPKIDAAKPDEIFESVSAAFKYNTEFGGEMCPPARPEQIADIMTTNPKVHLRLVIRGKSERYRRTKMNKWLHILVDQQGVPRNRIRVFLTHKLEGYYPYQDVEFWFVPSSPG